MTTPRPPFTLPAKPVDRYRVEWFELRNGQIVHGAAEYHVNSPLSEVLPPYSYNKDGRPVCDEWMHFSDGTAQGRSSGWDSLVDPSFRWDRAYATKKAALQAAIEYWTRKSAEARLAMAGANEHIETLTKVLAELP